MNASWHWCCCSTPGVYRIATYDVRSDNIAYFNLAKTYYDDVEYIQLNSATLTAANLDSVNTLVVCGAMAKYDTQTNYSLTIKNIIKTWIQAGVPNRRLVMMGEFPSYSANPQVNARINDLASDLGVASRVDQAGPTYDSGMDKYRYCSVNSFNYLIALEVRKLCLSAAARIRMGGNSVALAFTYTGGEPFVIEEDYNYPNGAYKGGSIVMSGDASIFGGAYIDSGVYDMRYADPDMLDKNLRLWYNLATKFRIIGGI